MDRSPKGERSGGRESTPLSWQLLPRTQLPRGEHSQNVDDPRLTPFCFSVAGIVDLGRSELETAFIRVFSNGA
jgi:hypothetical protein